MLFSISAPNLIKNVSVRENSCRHSHISSVEVSYNTVLGLDTESAEVTYGNVGGTDAIIVQKNGHTSILWTYTDRHFLIMTQASLDSAICMAESVVLID